MKLKSIEIHKVENLPDHIVQEVHDLSNKLGEAVYDLCIQNPSNIVLGALNWTHAAMTNHLVVETDEAIELAARQQAAALYNNIMHCYKNRPKKDEESNAD